jgi:hypothetical protein
LRQNKEVPLFSDSTGTENALAFEPYALQKRGTKMAGHHSDPKDCRGRRRSMAPARRAPALALARVIGLVASVLLWVTGPAGAENALPQPIPLAIVDFDYSDTSGEVLDQSEKHRTLLETFAASLRRDLARGGKYRIVALPCPRSPCSAGRSNPADLLARARDAGAVMLLYGRIHKMSTLVQWAKVQVVDVRRDKLVFDRLLTFRGDDARAWQRAQAFVVAEIEKRDLSGHDRNEAAPAQQEEVQP